MNSIETFDTLLAQIRFLFKTSDAFVPLHAPTFRGNEKEYVLKTIESTFVSSVGAFVDEFEKKIVEYTGTKFAIATMNGTAALHLALQLSGVQQDDLVITQPVTFIATCNAISYLKASPCFVDVDRETLSLSPMALQKFLSEECVINNMTCFHKPTGKRIRACVLMHTFGLPGRIHEIVTICREYNILVVEDAAESLGSFIGNQHTGTIADIGILSFNGNKILTTGGGGMILTNREDWGKKAKYLSTQAKVPHPWDFVHDEVGYNYRLPNLNAALGVAQLEQLDSFLSSKRLLANEYAAFFEKNPSLYFYKERTGTRSNYWLNTISFSCRTERDQFLKYSNDQKVMTRPLWTLMNKLNMFKDCPSGDLSNSNWLEDRVVNIPSSVR